MELFLELLNRAIFELFLKLLTLVQLQTLAMRLDKVINHLFLEHYSFFRTLQLFLEHYSCSSIKSYYNLHTLHKSVDCS